MALQVAFTMGVQATALEKSGSWEKLSFANDFGPLAAIATAAGLTWIAVLLYIDAVVSPADTGLVYTTIASRVSYAFGRNGNAPRWLATTSNRGVPWWSLVLVYVHRAPAAAAVPELAAARRVHHERHGHLVRRRSPHGRGAPPPGARP